MRTGYAVCFLLAVLSVAAPSDARRFDGRKVHSHHHQLKHLYDARRETGLLDVGLRALCIPTTAQVLENHEGRHECAYDHPSGFRAVGVGYNLDDEVEQRKTEMRTLLADYDKVYNGDECLYNLQITALLALDAKRALDRAAKTVAPLDNFCCEMQAVFADVQHSLGGLRFPRNDLEGFIEKAALEEWSAAARELKDTEWCNNHKERCEDNVATVENGCSNLFMVRS